MSKTKQDTGTRRRWGLLVLMAACLALLGAGTAFAEEREPIEDITLEIETGIEVGNSSWSVHVYTDDDDYSVDGAEVINASGEWAGGMIPRIAITLEADDGYYFPNLSADNFSLSGEGAKYVTSSRKSNNTVLNLEIRLDKLDEQDLSVSSAWWNKNDGSAQWERVTNAKYYEINLYRGSSLLTTVTTRNNSTCTYSFIGYLGSAGKYRFEVRAIGAGSAEGDWESSETWNRTATDTSDLRGGGSSSSTYTDDRVFNTSNSSRTVSEEEEDTRVFNVSNSAYSEDDEGEDSDGPGDDYYDGSDTSDGPGASSNKKTVSSSDHDGPGAVGVGDSYNTGRSADGGIISDSQNCWYKDQGGWWYHLEDDNYPYNTWELIDGKWYCFSEAGYVRHGWVQDGDNWYFCDLQNGAMLTDAETPDGCYVGADGVWVH